MENLTDTLANTHLSGPPEQSEQLLFRPQVGSGLLPTALDNVPRYLFRVVSPKSVGATNETWVHSESVSQNQGFSMEDVFFNLNSEKRTTIARTLNLHLRWWPKDGTWDNFVSWTSSLLFAIQYIYYRHLNPDDRSSLQQIKLYAVDTTQFPKGTFLCDLDLIDTFWKSDDHPPRKNLESLRDLRNKTQNYFGEYLSQGSLKIEGKCEVICAQSLFENDRLRRLQPHFREFQNFPFNKGRPIWPQEVLRLRESIWQTADLQIPSSADIGDRLKAVKEIVQDLEPRWTLPLALYFTSLIGQVSYIEQRGVAIHNLFFENLQSIFPDGQRALRPYDIKIIAPDTMPEMKQVKELVHEMYKYHALENALDRVATAEASIRGLHFDTVFSEDGHAFVLADRNELLDRTGQSLLTKIRSVQYLCEEVISAIS
ncbi:hypothetical protein BDV39DRAFT_176107 [Aspergillus sergii]|uniref:DUF7587 domain-containing protein n=1 Tax=Aspergillus sergii TaxID=1034303 RepID=A0A5N6X1D5_9EURO|nr:hypothetical protein BDV39DRAFT_176107 [Aspergillus sergii]